MTSPEPELEALRVVVTGGREYASPPRRDLAGRVAEALRVVAASAPSGAYVAHGANPAPLGGDALCGLACAALAREGLPIRVRGFAVEPARDGSWPAAGNLRNARMVRAHRPRLALGFPDPRSRGTWHCLAEAARAGADLLVDLAALPGEEALEIARARLAERGFALPTPARYAGAWLAVGPLAESML